ncbi:hypothetical protein [Pedobacter heparinus]|uniref:hypothetical protein n=1 Tax=Pedobacter heparinus TaxID=984 RepID=UPI00292D934D|nr:hypothetical protein [Pedobacter heparinus]
MKFKETLLAASILLLSQTACNQNHSGRNNPLAEKENVARKAQADETEAAKVPFTEGKIDLKITTPGSALGELLQQVDPTKGNVSAQIKKLSEKLSVKDRAELEAQNKKAGMMNLAILMLPLKSVIYIKGDQATAKFDALTFHGENTVNDAKKEGMMYVKSQNSSKAMTIAYTGDSFKEMAQNELKTADYNIKETGETSTVAGYNCSKCIYTLKKPAPANNTPGVIPAASVYKLEVWTSTEMPKSVNFLHPLYIKEDAGIMKIMIQYQKDSPLKFLYEFTKVENRVVTTEEMQIQKTAKIHDFGKDKMTVGMQMMGIVFGM